MLRINIKERPEITVKVNINNDPVTVVIKPLPKNQDIALEKKYKGGQMKVQAGRKNRKNPEIALPDKDYFNLNLERAKSTWQSWDIADEAGKVLACSAKNIELIFDNFYDLIVTPILDKYDEIIEPIEQEEKAQETEKEKN